MRKNIVLKYTGVSLVALVMFLSTMVVTGDIVSKNLVSSGSMTEEIILFEGFEDGVMPPRGWSVHDDEPGITWRISDYAQAGNYGAEFGYDFALGSSLISPIIDCLEYEELLLEFWHCQFGESLIVSISVDGGNTWNVLDYYSEDMLEYEYEIIDISNWVGSSQMMLRFRANGADGQSGVWLDTITVSGTEGRFQGSVDPLGEAIVTEIPNGYFISNVGASGNDGGLFIPQPAYSAFTCNLNLNDLPEGTEIKMIYNDKNGNLLYQISTGVNYGGIYPVGFSGSASGAPSIVGEFEGDEVFSGILSDGDCGEMDYDGVHPVVFSGSADGAPSIIVINVGGEIFKWKWNEDTYYVDRVVIRQDPNPYNTGIGKCSMLGKWPSYQTDTTLNPGGFTATNVRSSDAPFIPTISGPLRGIPGIEYTYNVESKDPNGDNVYYLTYWGDGTSSGWTGPYKSEEITDVKHMWSSKGNYIIRVKARDSNRIESDWATLAVSMPKNRAVNRPFVSYLENHPYMFPILRILLQRLELM
jgi:hypothetical protein